MTVLIQESGHKASIAVPERVQGVWTVESALVFRSGVPTMRGVELNDLSPLWPMSMLRDELMKGAKKFVADMAKHGLELLTAEGSIHVYGPWKARGWDENATATQQTKHHVRGNSLTVPKTVGRTADETKYPGKVDFIFIADFLARRGVATETPPPTLSGVH